MGNLSKSSETPSKSSEWQSISSDTAPESSEKLVNHKVYKQNASVHKKYAR
ncbi:hypothetical protein GCM10009001_08210 [Virgibacillus siamensis]|uniref:Uncharacterized protein n=1 Tax=Virgibacillus siamensis TaxID=480071 RepID=A0ABN1FNG4_9BACI